MLCIIKVKCKIFFCASNVWILIRSFYSRILTDQMLIAQFTTCNYDVYQRLLFLFLFLCLSRVIFYYYFVAVVLVQESGCGVCMCVWKMRNFSENAQSNDALAM